MQPIPNYMASVQKGKLQPFMRRMVYEWNLTVADHPLRLTNQALLLAFNYFDRYMSFIPCPKTKLQLVSTACLWVASKVQSTCFISRGGFVWRVVWETTQNKVTPRRRERVIYRSPCDNFLWLRASMFFFK